ncbi:hypothetical protein D3C72_1376680 [compost metagenome]
MQQCFLLFKPVFPLGCALCFRRANDEVAHQIQLDGQVIGRLFVFIADIDAEAIEASLHLGHGGLHQQLGLAPVEGLVGQGPLLGIDQEEAGKIGGELQLAIGAHQQAGDGVIELGHGLAHGIQGGEALQEASHIIGVIFGDLLITEFGGKQGGEPPVELGPAFAGSHKFLHFSSVDGNREP